MKDALPTTPPSDALEYAVALLTQIRHEWYTFTGYSQLKQDIDKFLDTPRAGGRVVPLHPAKSCSEGVEAGSVTQSESASSDVARKLLWEARNWWTHYKTGFDEDVSWKKLAGRIDAFFNTPPPAGVQSAIGSIDYKALYHDLLFAVESKWPGETRHQTAMRYIQQSERGDGIAKEAK